jgi:hypothetical protein
MGGTDEAAGAWGEWHARACECMRQRRSMTSNLTRSHPVLPSLTCSMPGLQSRQRSHSASLRRMRDEPGQLAARRVRPRAAATARARAHCALSSSPLRPSLRSGICLHTSHLALPPSSPHDPRHLHGTSRHAHQLRSRSTVHHLITKRVCHTHTTHSGQLRHVHVIYHTRTSAC